MANTFFGLTIGTTGLYGANVGINTTAHNISNTETDGYTRQVVEKRAGTALRTNASYGMIGTGVEITAINQIRDQYYDEKYRSNNTNAGYYTCQDYYMKDIENYFNEVQLEGFNSNFDTFYDSIQELSKDPSSLTVRTQLNSYAQSFTDYVNALQVGMEKIQDNVNIEINTMVESINSYAMQIAGLTKQINTLEVTGGKANDLRDQRNLLIDELSNIVNISVDERIVGMSEVGVTSYTVKIGDSTLVDTYEYNTMHVVPRSEKMNQSDIEGLYDIAWESDQRFNPFTNGGRLQALFEVRDGNNQQYFNGRTTASYGDGRITVTDTSINKVELLHIAESGIITVGNRDYVYDGFQVTVDEDGKYVYEFDLAEDLKKDVDDVEVAIGKSINYKGINYYMQQLDEFARVYTQRFNDLHKSGKDLYDKQGLDYFNSRDKVTGENYVFESTLTEKEYGVIISSRTGDFAVDPDSEFAHNGSYYLMTAGRLCITDEIYADPSKVVASSDVVNGVSQNDIALQMIALKSDTKMFKQGTPSGYLQSLIAELGIDASKAASFAKNNEDIIATIQNQRLSVSGVDMDEESMALVRFQNAYNLSAKVISTMNELYDRLINYMGA
ncbi:MAG: flagellar hook-associated protein FlgK [Lachnospiraceae bacterium]|nr:flagellar hook-associated protein FlgK [Lachnospiraceae bacterium]